MRYIAILVVPVMVLLFAVSIWASQCRAFMENTRITGEFTINKGESYTSAKAKILKGLNPPAGFDRYLTHILKSDKTLHYGYYRADNLSLADVFSNVSLGKQTLLKVTIPEGYNMYDAAKAFERAGVAQASDMLKLFTDRDSVRRVLGGDYESMEGFLAPGTYFFAKGYPAERIAKALVEAFYKALPKDFEALAKKRGLTFYEAVTLASIVQKETYKEEESPLVASVFINRLKKKMRLQADPTIIYGKYEIFDGDIRRKDINDTENRFNTYTHNGLPPTPISNPSSAALYSVAHPKESDYLYFVASSDGSHIFTKTYEEHLKNVNKYQKRR